ncbi:MAG: VWA domain-containing protein [bacterium]|nr:MAG: VWA domain-containing protein [bacterium]
MIFALATTIVLSAALAFFIAGRDAYHSPLGSWILAILRAGSLGLLAVLAFSGVFDSRQHHTVVIATDQDTLDDPRLASDIRHLVAKGRAVSDDVRVGSIVTRPWAWDEQMTILEVPVSGFTRRASGRLWTDWALAGKGTSTLVLYTGLGDRFQPVVDRPRGRVLRVKIPPPVGTSSGYLDPAPSVFAGIPFEIPVDLSRWEPPGTAQLYIDNALQGSRDLPSDGGSRDGRMTFTVQTDGTGEHSVRLHILDNEGNTVHREATTFRAAERPDIHYISLAGSRKPLMESLRSRGYRVRPLPHTSLLSTRTDPFDSMEDGDLVIFDAIPDSVLGDRVTGRIVDNLTRRNLALLFIPPQTGGRDDGYPFERVLPVLLTADRGEMGDRTLAVVAVVDTSFSMYRRQEAGGPRKIEMAQRALVNLATAMADSYRLGVLGVDFSPYWILHPTADRDVQREIRRIERMGALSGGINLYSGLRAAFNGFEGLDTDIKHVLVLLDTADVDEYEVTGIGSVWDILGEFRESGITMSLVGIGTTRDEHIPFLNRFAEEAGGFLYLATDIRDIPGFFLEDLDQIEDSPVIRKPMKVFFSSVDFPSLEAGPDVEGQTLTTLKPGAALLSWTELGYPLLASWRIGTSTVAVFNADNGALLARDWLTEDGSRIWDGILAAIAPSPGGDAEVFASKLQGGISLDVAEGRDDSGSLPAGHYFDRRGDPVPLSFQEAAPGIFNAFIEDPGQGALVAEISLGDGGEGRNWAGAGLASSTPAKDRDRGGMDAAEVAFESSTSMTEHLKDAALFRLLILAAVCLLVFESLFRVA